MHKLTAENSSLQKYCNRACFSSTYTKNTSINKYERIKDNSKSPLDKNHNNIRRGQNSLINDKIS